jgi:hypothetical protein
MNLSLWFCYLLSSVSGEVIDRLSGDDNESKAEIVTLAATRRNQRSSSLLTVYQARNEDGEMNTRHAAGRDIEIGARRVRADNTPWP